MISCEKDRHRKKETWTHKIDRRNENLIHNDNGEQDSHNAPLSKASWVMSVCPLYYVIPAMVSSQKFLYLCTT